MPIGSIITAVAVLEIHMDKNAVAIIKPRMIIFRSVPIHAIIFRAILLWRFHFSMAMEMINPPIYRKINLWPKEAVVDVISRPPVRGKRTMGRSEVTAIGRASDIHQIAIQTVEAMIAFPSSVKPSALKNSRMNINMTGPRYRPVFLNLLFLLLIQVTSGKFVLDLPFFSIFEMK